MISNRLVEHAELLAASPAAGAPRQIDLRRAVGAAYYALFHEACRLVADQLVGVSKSATAEYARCYRAVQHARAASSFKHYTDAGGSDSAVLSFCDTAKSLQNERHLADYDPHYKTSRANALLHISTARRELSAIRRTSEREKLVLATILVFSQR